MNSKVIKFDQAPQMCNSNHQTVPFNMISLSNKKAPIVLQETTFFGSLARLLLIGPKFT